MTQLQTRADLALFIDHCTEALAEVCKAYDVRMSIEAIQRFQGGTRFRMEAWDDANEKDLQRLEFNRDRARNAETREGLKEEWFGRIFRSREKTYKIIGVRVRASKRPVLVEQVNTVKSNRHYAMSVNQVRKCILFDV